MILFRAVLLIDIIKLWQYFVNMIVEAPKKLHISDIRKRFLIFLFNFVFVFIYLFLIFLYNFVND